MRQKFIILIAVILLLSVALVSAERLVLKASLVEGETRSYTVDGSEFVISLIIVSDYDEVKFNINGVTSDSLREGDSHNIDETHYLKVDAIRPNDESWGISEDIVDFSIFDTSPYCGDAVCNAEETCSSCEQDCGECVIRCGDGICHPGESCEADNCCSGNEVDLRRNYFFCGSCSNSCNAYEKCVNSQCTGTCGNGYCETGEDQGSCPADCGYPPECAADNDCDDGDACTSDFCSQIGTCLHIDDKTCLEELEDEPRIALEQAESVDVQENEVMVISDSNLDAIEDTRNDSAPETLTEEVEEMEEKESRSLFSRIIQFFRSLFKL